jgi:hypothetical protein
MRLAIATLVAAAAMVPLAANAQSPTTTRIETRPFYGATVTLEEGVRVFRPLPPHGRVIINPGGTTPINLGIEEHRSVSHNYNYDYGSGDRSTPNDTNRSVDFSGDGDYGTYDRHRGGKGRHGSRRHGSGFISGGKH